MFCSCPPPPPPALPEPTTRPSRANNNHQDGSDTEPESDLDEPMLWTELEGVGDHGTPLSAAHEARESGNPPSTHTHPKRNCFRPAFVTPLVRGRETPLVDIEMCTPPLRAPCLSTGRSTPPSLWRSKAQSQSPARHSPPVGSSARIELRSPATSEGDTPRAIWKGPDASRRSISCSLGCETHTRLTAATLLKHCPPPTHTLTHSLTHSLIHSLTHLSEAPQNGGNMLLSRTPHARVHCATTYAPEMLSTQPAAVPQMHGHQAGSVPVLQ